MPEHHQEPNQPAKVFVVDPKLAGKDITLVPPKVADPDMTIAPADAALSVDPDKTTFPAPVKSQPADPDMTIDPAPSDPNATIGRSTSLPGEAISINALNIGELAGTQGGIDLRKHIPPGTKITLGSHTLDLIGVLGSGGEGTVYLAHDPDDLDRDIAIKRANSNRGASGSDDSIFKEARIIAQVTHPHIVPIYGVEREGKTPWFIYQYVQGGSLLDKLNAAVSSQETRANTPKGSTQSKPGSVPSSPPSVRGIEKAGRLPASQHKNLLPNPDGFTPEATAVIIRDIASALQAVHEKGFIHRDVKPGNILMGAKNHAFLADFGLAMQFNKEDRAKGSAQFGGTPSYMSPELAIAGLAKHDESLESQTVDVTPRSDVYSLGIVMHEMLSGGKKLFPLAAREPYTVVLKKILDTAKVPPPSMPGVEIPQELLRICAKALEKDPKERYQSAADMETDLQTFLSLGNAKNAPRSGMSTRTKVCATTALLLAGLGIGTGAAWTAGAFSGRPDKPDLPTPPAATAKAEPPPPEDNRPRTTPEHIRRLREWKLPNGKKVNLLMMLDPIYQDVRGISSTSKLKVKKPKGELETVPNNLSNLIEVYQNILAGNLPTAKFLIALRDEQLLPTTLLFDAALLNNESAEKPFSLQPKQYEEFLQAAGLTEADIHSKEIKESLTSGFRECIKTMEDYQALCRQRIKDINEANDNAKPATPPASQR